MNQPNAYDSASEDGEMCEDGQASEDSRTSEDGCEREASEDDCVRKASEDGRTAFDLSITIVMKSDAPLV